MYLCLELIGYEQEDGGATSVLRLVPRAAIFITRHAGEGMSGSFIDI